MATLKRKNQPNTADVVFTPLAHPHTFEGQVFIERGDIIMSEEIGNDGVTRREALKKGARLGGALVWAIPVVQTVGMSSAMAQTVSEGNCCLEVNIVSIDVGDFDTGVGNNDIRVTFNGTNCGTAQIFDVTFKLERRKTAPALGIWTTVADGVSGGNPNPGQTTGTQQVITNLTNGTYEFRLSGTKACVDGGAPLPHDTPQPFATGGPVVVNA